MRPLITLIYNKPRASRYWPLGEMKAVLAVAEEMKAVYRALLRLGFRVSTVALSPPMDRVSRRLERLKTDLVFNLFEGFDGEPMTEALVPEILASLHLPYTGNRAQALRLCLDKLKAKGVLQSAGLPTPKAQMMNLYNLDTFNLGFPCIVKPLREDASHGISEQSVVEGASALARQVGKVSRNFGGSALVEEFVGGREFNVTVMGNDSPEVFPISEITYALPLGMPRLLTYASKWDPLNVYFQHTTPKCPTDLEPEERAEISDTAVDAFRALGCRGYARIDFRQGADGVLYVLEVNPNPDISPEAGSAIQAKAAGLDYERFIERIVALAL